MATGRVPTTANSPLTAKGDLFGYSTTQARVAVGNDGETLVADSSATTGLRYTAGTVQANPVLNSAFQVWQRGTSFSFAASTSASSSTYTADRWQMYTTGANQAVTISRQLTNDTTNLPNIQYALRFQRNSGQTGTGDLSISQMVETANSIPFAGKTVTYSFYARAGANFSASSNLLQIFNMTGTGTDQNSNTGAWTNAAAFTNSTATLTTTWQRFTYTATLATNTSELSLNFKYTPTGTAGAADFFEVTGVQLDIGSVALPFRTYAGTLAGELAACQRYYTREAVTTTYAYFRGSGNATSTTVARIIVPFPVQMRVKPSALDYGGALAASDGVNLYGTGSFVLSANCTTQNAQVEYTHGSAALTQYRYYSLQDNNNGATYVGFSAEL